MTSRTLAPLLASSVHVWQQPRPITFVDDSVGRTPDFSRYDRGEGHDEYVLYHSESRAADERDQREAPCSCLS